MNIVSSWLTPAFWGAILQRCVAWAITAVPAIVVILLLAGVGLKLLAMGCRQLAARAQTVRAGEPAHVLREQAKRAETLLGIVQKAGRIAIWVVVGMLLLMQVGVNVAPLIAGAGILGLAVGFGAQELVRDVITGFFILLEDHIRVGDVAVINGTGGLVESIGLRTIVLRDLAGVVHIFQNGKIGTLSNMTKEWSAMVFDVRVAYKEDTDKVIEVMREVASSLQQDESLGSKILEPIEVFGVDSFADSAVVIKARLKTQPIEQWAVGREYLRRLKKAFDAEGIEIPFPHRTLYFGEASPPFQTLPLSATPARAATDRGAKPPEPAPAPPG
jgi:small conductance mechanosensitive channel